MIKRLMCWVWSHNFETTNTRRWTKEDEEGREVERGLKMWCKRCQRYMEV